MSLIGREAFLILIDCVLKSHQSCIRCCYLALFGCFLSYEAQKTQKFEEKFFRYFWRCLVPPLDGWKSNFAFLFLNAWNKLHFERAFEWDIVFHASVYMSCCDPRWKGYLTPCIRVNVAECIASFATRHNQFDGSRSMVALVMACNA